MTAAERMRAYRARIAATEGRQPGKVGRPRTRGCGTVAGYKRHQRAGETPVSAYCSPCADAWTVYAAQRREAAEGT